MTRDEAAQLLVAAAEPRVTPFGRLIADEGRTWIRPSGRAAFPLIRDGRAELYGRSVKLLIESGAADRWNEQTLRMAAGVLAAAVEIVFRPGGAVREGVDRLAEDLSPLYPSDFVALPRSEQVKALRFCALCGWTVVKAACEWAKEAA